MTLEQNITAILESYFSGFKDELIEACVQRIMKQIERQADTPQTDCAWMYDSRRDYEYDKALDEMERNFVEFEEYDDGEDGEADS